MTDEQVEALEMMAKAFGIGPEECFLHNVRDQEYVWDRFGYTHWIRRSARETLVSWGQLKYALTLEGGMVPVGEGDHISGASWGGR